MHAGSAHLSRAYTLSFILLPDIKLVVEEFAHWKLVIVSFFSCSTRASDWFYSLINTDNCILESLKLFFLIQALTMLLSNHDLVGKCLGTFWFLAQSSVTKWVRRLELLCNALLMLDALKERFVALLALNRILLLILQLSNLASILQLCLFELADFLLQFALLFSLSLVLLLEIIVQFL